MDKTKRLIVIAAASLIAGALAYYYNDTKQIYGNVRESIMKVIHSIEGHEEKQIKVVQIKDFNDKRIVGLLGDSDPGYIQFQKNKNGDYRWQHIQFEDSSAFSIFIPDLDQTQLMIVTNHHNEIAKMQVDVNGQLVEQEFVANQPSVTWVNLPESDNGSHSFRNYRYFDKDGNRIE